MARFLTLTTTQENTTAVQAVASTLVNSYDQVHVTYPKQLTKLFQNRSHYWYELGNFILDYNVDAIITTPHGSTYNGNITVPEIGYFSGLFKELRRLDFVVTSVDRYDLQAFKMKVRPQFRDIFNQTTGYLKRLAGRIREIVGSRQGVVLFLDDEVDVRRGFKGIKAMLDQQWLVRLSSFDDGIDYALRHPDRIAAIVSDTTEMPERKLGPGVWRAIRATRRLEHTPIFVYSFRQTSNEVLADLLSPFDGAYFVDDTSASDVAREINDQLVQQRPNP